MVIDMSKISSWANERSVWKSSGAVLLALSQPLSGVTRSLCNPRPAMRTLHSPFAE